MNIKKYKVVFWANGNKKVEIVEVYSRYNAKARFYLNHPADDIISVEEVVE